MAKSPNLLAIIASFTASMASATLPDGLTKISLTPDARSRLAVIDGVAYISNRTGVTPISNEGRLSTLSPLASAFGEPDTATGVVESDEGELYVGINYPSLSILQPGGSTLFRVADSLAAVVSWRGEQANGFDSSLRGFSCTAGDCFGSAGSRLVLDGSTEQLPNLWMSTVEVTSGGTAIGNAAIPNSLGSAIATLDVDDNITFLSELGGVVSARERLDGTGINYVGVLGSPGLVYFGNGDPVLIDGGIGDPESPALVSESDFIVIRDGRNDPYLAFFPGINPERDNLSVPLLDYYPELQSLDFDTVTDITSADGQIHLLLSGNDGLWLYTATDPTVVPESTTWASILIGLVSLLFARKRLPM